MKTLELTDTQSELLERVLSELIDEIDASAVTLSATPSRERVQMLRRIWWKTAKLEGKAE